MLKFRKKNKEENIRIIRIYQELWLREDMTIAAAFLKSPTFVKMIAWCNQQLLVMILHHGASEEYRKGYIDALSHIQSFNMNPPPLEDSREVTTMQDLN